MKKLMFTASSSKKLNEYRAEERKRDTRRKILIGARVGEGKAEQYGKRAIHGNAKLFNS